MKVITQANNLSGSITIPGSKGHTIRACLFASLAEGESLIYNPLMSSDCIAFVHALEMLGAKIEKREDFWRIQGAGNKLHLPENIIDVGNCAPAIFFLTPIASIFHGWSVITGDKTILCRPVHHLLDALNQLGCQTHITRPNVNAPPFIVQGPLHTGVVVTEGDSSQHVTGLICATLLLLGKTEIILKDPKEIAFLHMTELWIKSLRLPVHFSSDYKRITIEGPHKFSTFNKMMPSDWESTLFPLIAALITDSEIRINKIDTSDSQAEVKIITILQEMGADIEIIEDDTHGKTGYLIVRGGCKSRLANKGQLQGKKINCSFFLDAVPILSVLACFAQGETVLEDIGQCRKKETDRIEIMAKELIELGADIKETVDALIIRECKNSLHGGTIESYEDHRVAMALAVLGLAIKDEVQVNDAQSSELSFPNFFETMNQLGCNFTLKD
ncbi:MAG: 3-phosphoshikimate 1-carboxyvinyltransferase [Treponemataceae bacterium]